MDVELLERVGAFDGVDVSLTPIYMGRTSSEAIPV
jgi:hypothetical protein